MEMSATILKGKETKEGEEEEEENRIEGKGGKEEGSLAWEE